MKQLLFTFALVSSLGAAQGNSWGAVVSAEFARTIMPGLTAGVNAWLSAPLSGGNASLNLEPNWKWTLARFGLASLSGEVYVGQGLPLNLSTTTSLNLNSRVGLNLSYGLLEGLALRSSSEAGYGFGVANVGLPQVQTTHYLRSDLRLELAHNNYSLGAGAELTVLPSVRPNYFARASYDASPQLSFTARYDTNFQGFNLALASLYRLSSNSTLEGLLETSQEGSIRARLKLGLSF